MRIAKITKWAAIIAACLLISRGYEHGAILYMLVAIYAKLCED